MATLQELKEFSEYAVIWNIFLFLSTIFFRDFGDHGSPQFLLLSLVLRYIYTSSLDRLLVVLSMISSEFVGASIYLSRFKPLFYPWGYCPAFSVMQEIRYCIKFVNHKGYSFRKEIAGILFFYCIVKCVFFTFD